MKIKEKLFKIVKSKYLYYLLFAFICCLLFILDLQKAEHSSLVYLLFWVFSLAIIILIFVFMWKFKNIKYENYHKIYFILVLIFGLVFVIIAPPFMGSDERAHLSRIYEISEGHLITTTSENGILATMPRSLNQAYSGSEDENIKLEGIISYNDIKNRLAIPLNKENQLNYCSCNDTNYFGASMYSPFQYIPHLIAVEIAKILDIGPTWMLYLARIFNLLAFAILTTFGIKALPKFKLPAMLILLTPVVLAGATTVSADGITNAVVFLFIAYIANIVVNKRTINLKDEILLGILAILIAMCKIVYFPIISLIFLISKESFKTKKQGMIFKISIFVIGLLLSLVWYYFASSFLDSQSTTSALQKDYIFKHPIQYIFVLIRTNAMYIDANFLNIFFGNQLYHWQLKVYPLFSLLYVLVIFISLFTEKGKFALSKNAKIFIIILIFVIIGLIDTALFIQHNGGVGSGIIGGIQARYFIPIILLSLLLLNVKKAKFSKQFIFEIFILLYLPAILTIVVRFI